MGCQSIAGLPPALHSPVTIYTPGKRGTVRVKCLAQETSALTMRPLRLPRLDNGFIGKTKKRPGLVICWIDLIGIESRSRE